MSKWRNIVVQAMLELGGTSNYEDLYEYILSNSKGLAPSWKSGVRRTIEQHSSDSQAYLGKFDLFYSVHGIGKGVWGLRNNKSIVPSIGHTEDDSSFPEGELILRTHLTRERNPKVVNEAKKRFKKEHGKLFCEICNFDFEKTYGGIGADFIEGHHSRPVSEMNHGDSTDVKDIVLVCSNCHRMLHRRRPWLTRDDLLKLLG